MPPQYQQQSACCPWPEQPQQPMLPDPFANPPPNSFCGKCGAQISAGHRFCSKCGEMAGRQSAYQQQNTDQQTAPPARLPVAQSAAAMPFLAGNVTVKKASFNSLIVLSIIQLFTIVFIPMFDVWGGLFPGDADYHFWDVVANLFEGTDFNMWIELFSWSAFVPAVILLISSIAKGRIVPLLSSASGAGLLLFNLFSFIDQNSLSDVFDFEDCDISIGFWIALLLFVICIFRSIKIMKNGGKTGGNSLPPMGFAQRMDGAKPQAMSGLSCVKCGSPLYRHANFCGQCGQACYDEGKGICILSYMGLWIVGFASSMNRGKSNVRFHTGQGIMLSAFALACNIAIQASFGAARLSLASSSAYLMLLLPSLAIGILNTALMILGIIRTGRNEIKPLPVIGRLAFYGKNEPFKEQALTVAAIQGDVEAQFRLGHYFFFEAKHIDNAVYWLCLSEANGSVQAQQILQTMVNTNVPRIYERMANARASLPDISSYVHHERAGGKPTQITQIIQQPYIPAPNAQQPYVPTEAHILQIEHFIQHANPNDLRLTDAYRDAAYAYLMGTNGAQKNKEKIKHYLDKAAEYWDGLMLFVKAMSILMDAEAMDWNDDGRLTFIAGIMFLMRSHLVGYQPATNALYDYIRENMWPGATRIEEMEMYWDMYKEMQTLRSQGKIR